MSVDRPIAPPAVDVDLLAGFRYACRPGCGLCCFATPRARRDEIERLTAAVPDLPIGHDGPDLVVLARPDGGACGLLRSLRCSQHALRPHPCREFPLTVHVGDRLQATVVLTCPGVDVRGLLATGDTPSAGFDHELASIRDRIGPTTLRRLDAAGRRHRRVARRLLDEGRWVPEEEVRATLAGRVATFGPAGFPVDEPPDADGPLEALPMYSDGPDGPRAIGARLGGWELLALAEEGGATTVGVGVPPTRMPPLEPSGRRLLDAYLGYVLRRDGYLASIALDALEGEDGSVLDRTSGDLDRLAATVVTRAHLRAQGVRGTPGPLSDTDVEVGIRMTDQEWLDRPSWGDRL